MCEKRLYEHIKVVVCKNCSKKHLIFDNWELFENGQNWPRRNGYSLCKIISLGRKGYSLCKMVISGQKLKMPKRCEKRFYEHIRVRVCKKPLQNAPNIRQMRAFWKWPKHKGCRLCKMVISSQKLKMPKRCAKKIYEHIRVVLCKQPLQNTPNIREMTAFLKWPTFASTQRQVFYLWKMVSLGQKLKMPKRCEKRCTSTLELLCGKNRSKKHLIFEKWDILKMGKIGHDAKAIAFAKCSVWVKN